MIPEPSVACPWHLPERVDREDHGGGGVGRRAPAASAPRRGRRSRSSSDRRSCAQVLHVREQRAAPGRVVAERVERHRELAGLGAGDPRVGVDAADAEPGDDELVPAAVEQRRGRPRRARRRRGPGSTSPSSRSTCPGTGRGARAPRGRAGRRRAPTPAAGRRPGRRARPRRAATGRCSRSRPAAPPRGELPAGRRAGPATRRSRRTAAASRPPSPARPARWARTGVRSRGRAAPASGATRRPRGRRDMLVSPHSSSTTPPTIFIGKEPSCALQRRHPCVGPLGGLDLAADEHRHRRLDVVPHVDVLADRPRHRTARLLHRRRWTPRSRATCSAVSTPVDVGDAGERRQPSSPVSGLRK